MLTRCKTNRNSRLTDQDKTATVTAIDRRVAGAAEILVKKMLLNAGLIKKPAAVNKINKSAPGKTVTGRTKARIVHEMILGIPFEMIQEIINAPKNPGTVQETHELDLMNCAQRENRTADKIRIARTRAVKLVTNETRATGIAPIRGVEVAAKQLR